MNIERIFLYGFLPFLILFYVFYFLMPVVFSLEKYPKYNIGRVICTKILIVITNLICYAFGMYIIWVAFGLFGWFALILLIFAKWILATPFIVSTTALVLHHSWIELALTILMTLPLYHFVQIRVHKE